MGPSGEKYIVKLQGLLTNYELYTLFNIVIFSEMWQFQPEDKMLKVGQLLKYWREYCWKHANKQWVNSEVST